jgi:ribose transport system substrate-binding protein
MPNKISVLLVGDHSLVRRGFRRMLEDEADLTVVGEAGDGAEAVRLAQELKGKGNVVIFSMPAQPNLQDRQRGYKDALDRSPNIKITRVVDIQGDPRVAFDTTTQIIGKERDKVDGFVCLEAQSGKEVAGVLNSYHVSDKVVMAMDTDPETLQWIQKGVIVATIAQKPYTMAYVGMQMLDNLYHHKPAALDRADCTRDSAAAACHSARRRMRS